MTKLLPGYVSAHFKASELADSRTGECQLEPGFLDALEALRAAYGHPMVVNDCCRSDETNEWLIARGYKASPRSFHLMHNAHYGTSTCALDIQRHPGPWLAQLIKEAQTRGWSIGLAPTFVHLDLRSAFTSRPQTFYTY